MVDDSLGLLMRIDEIKFGPATGLRDIHLELGPGLHALIGSNGSGKSTLLRYAACILGHRANQLTWDGHDALALTVAERASVRSAVLTAQRPNVALNVLEYVSTGSVSRRHQDRLVEALGQVESFQLGDLGSRDVRELSAGEWSWVRTAQATLRRPSILLLDEADAALDASSRHRFYQRVRESAVTILAVTHDLAKVHNWADTVWAIDGDSLSHQ